MTALENIKHFGEDIEKNNGSPYVTVNIKGTTYLLDSNDIDFISNIFDLEERNIPMEVEKQLNIYYLYDRRNATNYKHIAAAMSKGELYG